MGNCVKLYYNYIWNWFCVKKIFEYLKKYEYRNRVVMFLNYILILSWFMILNLLKWDKK